jgi:hypothetical protein
MRTPRSTHAVTVGLVIAALAPATAMAGQDLRSPDARDAATSAAPAVDLRAPDSRDAADGRGASKSPSVMVVKVPAAPHSSGGLDWGDAGIGASGALIVLALSTGGAVAVRRRRHVRSTRTPATV